MILEANNRVTEKRGTVTEMGIFTLKHPQDVIWGAIERYTTAGSRQTGGCFRPHGQSHDKCVQSSCTADILQVVRVAEFNMSPNLSFYSS